jgi:AcrR family transcriptional regulator
MRSSNISTTYVNVGSKRQEVKCVGRPPKFTRNQLQDAALEIVVTEGLPALSMRSLARRLGTGPMTLYNHVADRADLDVLVVDAVMATVDLPPAGEDPWDTAVEAIATAIWRAVRAHPEAIPLILTRRSRSAAVLDASEALLAALARSGLEGQGLLNGFRAVTAFVSGFAQAELASPLAGADDQPPELIQRVRNLGSARYPHLTRIAGTAATSDPQDEFSAGLRALLSGLVPVRTTPHS